MLTTIGAVLVLVSLVACKDKEAGAPKKAPTPPAVQVTLPANPNANQPGPVQGDPSAHDPSPQELQLQAIWETETKVFPVIEYDIGNGRQIADQKYMNMRKVQKRWVGFWSLDVRADSGVTYGFTMYGTPSFTKARCVILHHAQFHSPQETNRNCATSYRVP